MSAYIARRVLLMIPTLLGVMLLAGINPFMRMRTIRVPGTRGPLSQAFVYGMFAYAGVPVTFETLSVWLTGDIGAAADMRNWLWAVIAGVGVLTFVTAWFFVGLGARSAIKKRDKLAAKGR